MKKILLGILITTYSVLSIAQESDIGNFYQFSAVTYNPAATGVNDVFSLQYNYRNQWVGFEGAPSYNSFIMHTPMPSQKVALGLNLNSQSVGSRKISSVFGNYAYRIPFSTFKISMGIKAGLISFNDSDNELTDSQDPLFGYNFLMPNFGFGFALSSRKYYFGLSIPEVLYYRYDGRKVEHNFKNYKFFIAGAYNFLVTSYLDIQPSALFKINSFYKSSSVYKLSVRAYEKYMVGVLYRNNNDGDYKLGGMGSVLMFRANPQTDIGISYDFSTGDLAQIGNSRGTFEVLVQYQFSYKIKVSSPRNF